MADTNMRIKSLLNQVTRVPISEVRVHPRNPRQGDPGKIAESLKQNGQYRPIVVQKSTGFALAGNHTLLGARRLGWSHIDIVLIDVDDVAARRIMLADNKTAEDGSYDMDLIAEALQMIGDIDGTGYSQDEFDDMIEEATAAVAEATSQAAASLSMQREIDDREEEMRSFDGSPLGDEPEDDEDRPRSAAAVRERAAQQSAPNNDFEAANDELGGAMDLKADMTFTGKDMVGPWEIPRIRTDRVPSFDDIPENLRAWAGSATKNWPDPDQWWLYNYGIDSTSGMNDISKVIMSFYCYDDYFEKWWDSPEKYVKKVINSGIKMIVSPDFSMHTVGQESRVLSMWQLYRQRWLARYFQECGLMVIPNITWAAQDEPFLEKHILTTLPKNLPMIALQVQAMFSGDTKKRDSFEEVQMMQRQVQMIFDKLQPQGALIYYGKQGRAFMERKINLPCPAIYVESRLVALGEQASKRAKKTTI